MKQLSFKCAPLIALFFLSNVNAYPNDERPPNIIVVLVDDMGYGDVSCFGSTDVRTPNIDKLAATGIKYTSGYAAAPQCSPSRAGLMMGLQPAQFGYLDNEHHRGLPRKSGAPTMAEMLKELGYVTGIVGKWHLGDEPREIGKSWPDAPWERGFDYTLMHGGGLSRYFPYREEDQRAMRIDARLREVREGAKEVNALEFPRDSYLTDLFNDASLRFIERHQRAPFFLYLSYNAPHFPMQAKDEDLQANNHIDDEGRRIFAGMMAAVDRGIGQLLEKLESLGLRDETLIVFMSDNGGVRPEAPGYNSANNHPLSGYKGDMLDGGIRVPFIISYPDKVAPRQVDDQVVVSTDLFVTFNELGGGELRKSVPYPGLSLTPTWSGKNLSRGPVVWVWRSHGAVRDGSFKVIDAWEGDYYWNTSRKNVGLYEYRGGTEQRVENPGTAKEEKDRLMDALIEWRKKYQDQL